MKKLFPQPNKTYRKTIVGLLTRPIFSKRMTSSLLSSHRSRKIGVLRIAPDRLVTGKPDNHWCLI